MFDYIRKSVSARTRTRLVEDITIRPYKYHMDDTINHGKITHFMRKQKQASCLA